MNNVPITIYADTGDKENIYKSDRIAPQSLLDLMDEQWMKPKPALAKGPHQIPARPPVSMMTISGQILTTTKDKNATCLTECSIPSPFRCIEATHEHSSLAFSESVESSAHLRDFDTPTSCISTTALSEEQQDQDPSALKNSSSCNESQVCRDRSQPLHVRSTRRRKRRHWLIATPLYLINVYCHCTSTLMRYSLGLPIVILSMTTSLARVALSSTLGILIYVYSINKK